MSGGKVQIAIGLSCMIITGIVSCAQQPKPDDVASNTPIYYTENRFFYLGSAAQSHGPATQPAVPASPDDVVPLVQSWEIPANGGGRIAFSAGDPLAVILQGVRLPDDLPGLGTRDIAVILDVNMGADKGLQSFVAYYQRDVPRGQMLNFANLTVYSSSKLDPTTAPYFRVRVLDVKAERNAQAAQLLTAASKLNGEISGLIPHPLIPAVNVAIQAANVVLSNQQNQTLLDFQVQLYQATQADAAGDADLGRLYEGRWLILGRARDQNSDFWNASLYLNRRTGEIVAAGGLADTIRQQRDKQKIPKSPFGLDHQEDIYVPYIAIALVKTNLQVPSVVLDRAQTLLQLITSPAGKTDVDTLASSVTSLAGATEVFTAERAVTTNYTAKSMSDLINVIRRNNGQNVLSQSDINELLSFVATLAPASASAPGNDLSTVGGVIAWWNNYGIKGSFNAQHQWIAPLPPPPATQTTGPL